MRSSLFLLFFTIVGLSAQSVDEGLVGYWPLQGDARDYSGNEHHGILLDGASFIEDEEMGGLVFRSKLGQRYTGHIQVPSIVPLPNKTQDTVASGSVFVRFLDETPIVHNGRVSGISPIFSHNLGIRSLERTHHIDRFTFQFRNSNGYAYPAADRNNAPSLNEWYHLAWRYSTSSVAGEDFFEVYINGELHRRDEAQGFRTATEPCCPAYFLIGGSHHGYAGNVDIAEFRLYDRVISDEELLQLSRNETGQRDLEITEADLHVDGHLRAGGAVRVGDFNSTVDEEFNLEGGFIRFRDGQFEGFDGFEWTSLTNDELSSYKLTTPGQEQDAVVVSPDGTTTIRGPLVIEGSVRLSQPQGDIPMFGE